MNVVLRGMSEKKEVKSGGKTVIALLIVIVVLAASLGGVFYYFTSVVNAKNSTISSLTLENENLNKTVRDLEDRLSTLNTLKEDVQRHVDELTKERETLRTQISSLQTQISSLQAQISTLERERDSLRSQLETLSAPQLHKVNFNWEWHEPWLGRHYVHVSGAVFNSGTYTAKNVRINVWLYDSNHVLIRSYTLNLGDINGKTYSNFATDLEYGGHCADYRYEIVHD
jgi:peptidoglycan hydrolase CwlO-like protein